MAMYTLTIGERKIPITAKTFWTLLLVVGVPVLALSLFLLYLVWFGLYTLAGWLLVFLYIAVFGSVKFTFNDNTEKKWALIQNDWLRSSLCLLTSLAVGTYGFIQLVAK